MAEDFEDRGESDDEYRRRRPSSSLGPHARQLVTDTSRQAAKEAVNETFLSFGIDLNDDRSRREFFEDMIYIKNMRLRGKRIGMMLIGGIVAAITGIISTFLPSWFHR